MSKNSTESVESVASFVEPTEAPTESINSVEVDVLAAALHDAQVAELRKQAKDNDMEHLFSHSTWDDLTDASKESRRATARFLIGQFTILAK